MRISDWSSDVCSSDLQNYVIAHEFGHHIQNLLGTSSQVQQQMARSSRAQGNALSVRLELQADCYAGVWCAMNRARLDPGDIEEGMTAANAIGNDTLPRAAPGRVRSEEHTSELQSLRRNSYAVCGVKKKRKHRDT